MAAARRDCAANTRAPDAAHHDAPGVPAPRRDQDRAQDDDAGDQRGADRHDSGLRRRQPQRDGEREPGRVDARTRSSTTGPSGCPSICCRARAPITRSGSTARRSPARRKSSRIYGEVYLPRKFKAAFVVPPHNDVDVFANDLGFIAIIENGELQGFNLTRRWRAWRHARRSGNVPAYCGRGRIPATRAGARGGRSRAHDAARFWQSHGAQACAAQVHDRQPRPRLVRRRDHATPGLCTRTRPAV